ncbi:hypothetical protein ACQP25_44815 (plasmid) [Microtetraspora malaysiensis]|uniref:hypothetical protein n=1 Tax=Microtetraspora malaysiensis TaxID=161358 RepID=UPI003D8DDDE8
MRIIMAYSCMHSPLYALGVSREFPATAGLFMSASGSTVLIVTPSPIDDSTSLTDLAADIGRDTQLMQTVQSLGKELLASPAFTKELETPGLSAGLQVFAEVSDQILKSPGLMAAKEIAHVREQLGAGAFAAIEQVAQDLRGEFAFAGVRELGEQILSTFETHPVKSILDVVAANRTTAFAALSDFARLIQHMPPGPPSAPPLTAAAAGDPHISAYDAFTLAERAEVEIIPALTPAQMRMVLVSYMYVIVLLTVSAVALDNMEPTGVVTTITGVSAHGVAKWCSGLVGKAFDKLYPPE